MEALDQYKVDIGDNPFQVAIGNNISQYKTESNLLNIQVSNDEGVLESYSILADVKKGTYTIHKGFDWVSVSIVIIFMLSNIIYLLYPFFSFNNDFFHTSITLSIIGTTTLMGVMLGFKVVKYFPHKRNNRSDSIIENNQN